MQNFDIRRISFVRNEFHWKYLRSFSGHLNVAIIVSINLSDNILNYHRKHYILTVIKLKTDEVFF